MRFNVLVKLCIRRAFTAVLVVKLRTCARFVDFSCSLRVRTVPTERCSEIYGAVSGFRMGSKSEMEFLELTI